MEIEEFLNAWYRLGHVVLGSGGCASSLPEILSRAIHPVERVRTIPLELQGFAAWSESTTAALSRQTAGLSPCPLIPKEKTGPSDGRRARHGKMFRTVRWEQLGEFSQTSELSGGNRNGSPEQEFCVQTADREVLRCQPCADAGTLACSGSGGGFSPETGRLSRLPAAQGRDAVRAAGPVAGRGMARLAKPPYSEPWLRADVSFEVGRIFTNYSGDVSGRFLELASLTSPPAGTHPPRCPRC